MKRAIALVLPAVVMLASTILAQKPPEMPKPGPEQKKLSYFVGTWKSEGEMKPSPMGPGGKFTGTDHNEWLPGGFFLEMRSTGTTPMGNERSVAFIGYNAEEKMYTYDSFDSSGMHETSKGTVEGDTWTYTSDEKMGGQTFKGRFTMKQVSPTEYTFKFETSPDGATWTDFMDGKSTKVTAAAAAEKKATK